MVYKLKNDKQMVSHKYEFPRESRVPFHMIAHHLSEPAMNNYVKQQDILTALATAAEMLRGKGKKKDVAADLERLIKEIQKGE